MRTVTRSFYEAAVVQAVERVAVSLDMALDLAELARAAKLSPFHFHRIFRGMVGETPLEMHRRLRLERAASQLLCGTSPVTAIAFDAGYETHEAFTRAFRDAYGTSPSAFRQSAAGREGCAGVPRVALATRSGIHFTPTVRLDNLQLAQGEPNMKVILENMPPLRVAAVPHLGAYNRIAEAFQRLGACAASAGLLRQGAMMLAIYHDDPETTPVEQLRSEAAVSVPEDVALPKELVELRIPAGRYARATHLGSYTTLGDTWARMMGEWLPGSGLRVGEGPSYEVYRNTAAEVREEDLRTDLYIPVR